MPDSGNFDVNNRYSLFALSNAGNKAPVSLWADPTTHQLLFTHPALDDLADGNIELTAFQGGTWTIDVGSTQGTSSSTTQVGDSATVVTLKASNTGRIKLVVVNTSTAVLYVKEGSAATTSDWTYRLEQYDIAIIDDYSGVVTGIWASDTGGFANCTETT